MIEHRSTKALPNHIYMACWLLTLLLPIVSSYVLSGFGGYHRDLTQKCSFILPSATFTSHFQNPKETSNRHSFFYSRNQYAKKLRLSRNSLSSSSANTEIQTQSKNYEKDPNCVNIVLVAGFESFNKELYEEALTLLPPSLSSKIQLKVFSDSEIRLDSATVNQTQTTNNNDIDNISANTNPIFAKALSEADLFLGSLIFDYDDVLAISKLLPNIKGPRLCFECATELMEFNEVGTFSMKPAEGQEGGNMGPPPAVKAVLSKFSSGKEEDKLAGYIKLLKIGPQLLQFVPGEKAKDLRTWLEAYRYWNQGGLQNVSAMLLLLYQRCLLPLQSQNMHDSDLNAGSTTHLKEIPLPELEVTPDLGLLHPLTSSPEASLDASNTNHYFTSPKEYLNWRTTVAPTLQSSNNPIKNMKLAPNTAPRVAILLYRKHVITKLPYIWDLITQMEKEGILPIPIFINGVEAHTIVRDLLTSHDEIEKVKSQFVQRDDSYKANEAVRIDAVVNTIGFPLVGGPAGSMQAGRNVDLASKLLSDLNVPYIVACPLLLQSIPQWQESGVLGLQSVVLYSLPELDGAIDTVVLGGLVGDKIALVPERVRKLTDRIQSWVELRRTPKANRNISIVVYGFPPNVGAVGTAALLDVPKSLERLLKELQKEGYDVGSFAEDPDACGESLIAALATLCEDSVISTGGKRIEKALENKIERAKNGDVTVAETLSKPGGGLGGAAVRAFDVTYDDLEDMLGKYMAKKVQRVWPESERGPGVSAEGNFVVSGLQLGNVWITVQPLLGVEGDPMRLLFERDLTPHPQYCAAYETMKNDIGSQAVIHLGMHGTVEWLPGQPLGNDRKSWSDTLLGSLPNIYIYAANNPSESILAKRRGYGTLVSYNVPPYGRAGLYLELANLSELVGEYRSSMGVGMNGDLDLRDAIWTASHRCGILKDVPFYAEENNPESLIIDIDLPSSITNEVFDDWITQVFNYLNLLQDRLFSSGLHTLGSSPTEIEMKSYLEAYFGDRLSKDDCDQVIESWVASKQSGKLGTNSETMELNLWEQFQNFIDTYFTSDESKNESVNTQNQLLHEDHSAVRAEAFEIVSLLDKNTEELHGVLTALDGGYVQPAPGGDLLRDGTSVLPTGRNIHALDPYRMPSAGAWARGQRIAAETIRQHQEANDGKYPETVAVTLWGLDAIKTRGESVAIVLALVGATPVKEGTGRVVRFDLIPLEELKRPRIDVLASLSGIFRDSFANIVDLLDDMFERAAAEDEPEEMNYIRKHAKALQEEGVDRSAARLFSNPPGDYGSMVNELVGSGDWNDSDSLGDIWKSRNAYAYGRNEKFNSGSKDGSNEMNGTNGGTARPQVLEKLLETTERVVQEVDSVEYGLTDIQEYYANTGALKKAAENMKTTNPRTGKKSKVAISIVEAFGNNDDDSSPIPVREVEEVLRLEYRSKLLNPKWRDAMIDQGSGGAYEISQRMTAMVGWAATAEVDNFVFDQAAERYALDEEISKKLQKSNPEAFKNVIRRLLEAEGRGMWETDEDTLEKLRDLYSDADDLVEQVGAYVPK